ncbi:MAG: hypothetical protein PVI06_12620 [Desulfobacterales bacterium]|jgi:hypothetical protein
MKHPVHSLPLIALLLFSGFYLQACSYLSAGGRASPTLDLSPSELAVARNEARKLLEILNNTNNGLNTFKGVGKIRLWRNDNVQIAERVVWAGARPSRLSIVVLASGQPGPRLATDGKYLYYLDLRERNHPFKKIRTADASLEKILSLPVKSSDIIELLRGRVPLYEFSSAAVIRARSAEGYVLILEKRRRGVVEKIYLDGNKKNARKIEVFDSNGGLRYRAELKSVKNIEGYRVPLRLEISNEAGEGFCLEIDRYLANAPVSPSLFVLKPPASPDN